MKPLLPLAAALALSACTTSPLAGSPVRADGQAIIGQATRVGELIVTPQSVVEDSRCPINARCVWAGRLVIAARIDGPGWRETMRLTLGEQVSTHGAALTLVSAEPDKLAGAAVPPSAYRFSFEAR